MSRRAGRRPLAPWSAPARPTWRATRLLAVAMAAAVTVATAVPADGTAAALAPSPPAPSPTGPPGPPVPDEPGEPGPQEPVCDPGEGVLVTEQMAAAVPGSDGHLVSPAGESVAGGCGHRHAEEDLGWTGEAADTPDDAASDELDSDPFSPAGGGQRYYSYQFGDFDGAGPPDYWEQPVALPTLPDWPPGTTSVAYVWTDATSGAEIVGSLPRSGPCGYRGPVPAAVAPSRIADYRRHGHPRIFLYDKVPLRAPAREFRTAGGGWYHYMCGASTPAGIAAPNGRLGALEAVYYTTPHWVYARGWSAAGLTQAAPVLRIARSRIEGYDVVRTSPQARSVVALPVWMWAPAAGYDLRLGALRAQVRPSGILVRAPGVPLRVHDLRSGGCRSGGRADTGDSTAGTDCYLVFERPTGRDPAATYPVGLALRWTVTIRTGGGAPLGPPVTFWTTSVRQFQVGEVQVPVR